MGESATPLWPVAGAEEFDRRIRSLPPSPAPHTDALAELARLVGEQDPFRSSEFVVPTVPAPAAPLASEVDFAAFDAAFRTSDDDQRASPRYPLISVRDDHPAEPSPDVWAEGADGDADKPDAVPLMAADTTDHAAGGGSKHTLIVLAAVVVLTGGGLLGSFMAKPSSASIAAATATPTILAATGPSKVQPETPATGTDAPSEPSTLLDKNNNDGTGAAKVVNTVEQPVDLAQAIKPAAPAVATAPDATAAPDAAAVSDAAPALSSAFPEPHKVKTVLVRPDGSIIAQGSAPVSDQASTAMTGDQTSLAFDPRTSLPVVAAAPLPVDAAPADAPPSALPPKPVGKTTTRVTPPKALASTAQGGSALAEARTTVATPKTKSVTHVPPKPKPAAVADATPTATTPDAATPDPAPAPAADTGGAFAIQLGAAASQAEGQSTATRLATKYGLDGAPTVVQAQAGGKTVYRIRFGHLSQDGAKALCAKVKGAGGGCFVARN